MAVFGVVFLSLVWLFRVQSQACDPFLEVVYSWKSLEFEWPNRTLEDRWGSAQKVPIGIDVHGTDLIVTIPRWHGDGFPINLATIPRPSSQCIASPSSPVARPFPSLEEQKLGDCDGLQFVQGLEIEPNGLMWLADVGREMRSQAVSKCKPKLVLLNYDTGKIEHRFEFPASVVSPQTNFLNDVALDLTSSEDKFAFISNSEEGTIVVYSRREDRAWKVEHSSMKIDPKAIPIKFVHSGTSLNVESQVNGIALVPGPENLLIYSPISSTSKFIVNSSYLKRNYSSSQEVESLWNQENAVIEWKSGANCPELSAFNSDGLASDSRGFVYLSEVGTNALSRLNVLEAICKEPTCREVLAQDNTLLIWPDTITVDDQGYLWSTTRGWPIDRNRNFIVRIKVQET